MNALTTLAIGLAAAVLVTTAGPFDHAWASDCGPACGQQKNACLTAAKIQFRSARDACRELQTSCREDCSRPDVPPVDPDCLRGCGRTLGDCSREAAAEARDCVRDCKRGGSDDRSSCLDDCSQLAIEAPAACMQEFADCTAACGGSPSAAFVDVTFSVIE